MQYNRSIEIYGQDTEHVKANLATFFFFNNFDVSLINDNQMRVENLYPRFDLKRPPAAEINYAVFKWQKNKDCVLVEAEAELFNSAKLLKKRKKIVYTAIGTLILGDLFYTASGFFWTDFAAWFNYNTLAMLFLIPLIYLILHYHFFKMYRSKHHNDLDRILENLQFSKYLQ